MELGRCAIPSGIVVTVKTSDSVFALYNSVNPIYLLSLFSSGIFLRIPPGFTSKNTIIHRPFDRYIRCKLINPYEWCYAKHKISLSRCWGTTMRNSLIFLTVCLFVGVSGCRPMAFSYGPSCPCCGRCPPVASGVFSVGDHPYGSQHHYPVQIPALEGQAPTSQPPAKANPQGKQGPRKIARLRSVKILGKTPSGEVLMLETSDQEGVEPDFTTGASHDLLPQIPRVDNSRFRVVTIPTPTKQGRLGSTSERHDRTGTFMTKIVGRTPDGQYILVEVPTQDTRKFNQATPDIPLVVVPGQTHSSAVRIPNAPRFRSQHNDSEGNRSPAVLGRLPSGEVVLLVSQASDARRTEAEALGISPDFPQQTCVLLQRETGSPPLVSTSPETVRSQVRLTRRGNEIIASLEPSSRSSRWRVRFEDKTKRGQEISQFLVRPNQGNLSGQPRPVYGEQVKLSQRDNSSKNPWLAKQRRILIGELPPQQKEPHGSFDSAANHETLENKELQELVLYAVQSAQDAEPHSEFEQESQPRNTPPPPLAPQRSALTRSGDRNVEPHGDDEQASSSFADGLVTIPSLPTSSAVTRKPSQGSSQEVCDSRIWLH